VSVTCSSRRAAVLLLAAVALGCAEREPDTKPFRIEVTLDGVPLAAGITEFLGMATLESAQRLRLQNAEGATLVVTFDASAAPDLAFPPDLANQQVGVRVLVDDSHQGPFGESLRVPAIQVLLQNFGGGFEYRFILGEGTYRTETELPRLPLLFVPLNALDFPTATIIADNMYFEAAECGLVYYDRLRVLVGDREDLPHHTSKRITLGEPPVGWDVRHVLSWHRSGDCPDDVRTWTQAAMTRAIPAAE
jgi:hypothetical protein